MSETIASKQPTEIVDRDVAYQLPHVITKASIHDMATSGFVFGPSALTQMRTHADFTPPCYIGRECNICTCDQLYVFEFASASSVVKVN